MRNCLKICFCLYILFVLPLHGESAGRMAPVADNGETLFVASSAKFKVRAIIKTHKVQKGIKEKWDRKLSFVPSACTFSSWCSIVDEINITVNDNPIFIPHSLVSDLAVLGNGEIKIDGDKLSLLFESGDASESCFVKIEFDNERVKSKKIYTDDSMASDRLLQETTYHLVHE